MNKNLTRKLGYLLTAFTLLIFTCAKAENVTPPEANSSGQVFVFVSDSMPLQSVVQWLTEAQQIGAPVIIRGLVGGSLTSTRLWVAQLIQKTGNQGNIEIDPVAFESYGIQFVPAVVVTGKSMQCTANESCMTPPFDVVYGNVDLQTALKTIANEGVNAPTIANYYLKQIRSNR